MSTYIKVLMSSEDLVRLRAFSQAIGFGGASMSKIAREAIVRTLNGCTGVTPASISGTSCQADQPGTAGVPGMVVPTGTYVDNHGSAIVDEDASCGDLFQDENRAFTYMTMTYPKLIGIPFHETHAEFMRSLEGGMTTWTLSGWRDFLDKKVKEFLEYQEDEV